MAFTYISNDKYLPFAVSANQTSAATFRCNIRSLTGIVLYAINPIRSTTVDNNGDMTCQS